MIARAVIKFKLFCSVNNFKIISTRNLPNLSVIFLNILRKTPEYAFHIKFFIKLL